MFLSASFGRVDGASHWRERWEMVQSPPASAETLRDPGSIPGSGRAPEEGMASPPVFWLGEAHGQRSLAGYSPWGCRVGHD